MATTTNFGWTTPNDTDLVKDGAAAIRTLGQSIDTSLVDLKGGTTGQVLAKASGTDMDFVWSADAAGMANPMTTTGDTIYSSSGSTPARRAIGTTGQVLTVSGGIPVWATPAGGGKVLQVVFGNTTTFVQSTTTTYVDTGLTATITPASSSSKILVIVAQNGLGKMSNNTSEAVRLVRGSTEISALSNLGDTDNTGTVNCSASFAYLDSPATTSATTYKTQINSEANNSLVYAQNYNSVVTMSTIVLMEIGA